MWTYVVLCHSKFRCHDCRFSLLLQLSGLLWLLGFYILLRSFMKQANTSQTLSGIAQLYTYRHSALFQLWPANCTWIGEPQRMWSAQAKRVYNKSFFAYRLRSLLVNLHFLDWGLNQVMVAEWGSRSMVGWFEPATFRSKCHDVDGTNTAGHEREIKGTGANDDWMNN